MASSHRIRIAARLRPKIDGEVNDDAIQVVREHSSGASFISVPNPRDPSQVFKFPFTSCYGESATQEEIFHNDVEPMLDYVFQGVTVTIFAYGVTSSGKTHTMQGTKSQPGVIPRVVESMFDHCYRHPEAQISLKVSYMEIYRDEVYDLLVARETAPKLPVRENEAGLVFVANLTSLDIDSVAEFEAIYTRATKQRSVGATNLNRASSRSHAIVTIEATSIDGNKELKGKVNLVDLAGSENNKLTGNDPARMAESAAINKSLSVLGQVVHALNQGASRIPYRNSKLTRLLQDALGGSSIGLLICNLAPGVKFRQDTLNTLNFAVRTKNIENKPVTNERVETRPAPKQPAAPKPAPAVVQQVSTTSSRPSIGLGLPRPRSSLAPTSRVPRIPRASSYGGTRPNSRTMVEKTPEYEGNRSQSVGILMTEEEINERIAKAVEAEVARRLAEKERQWREEEEERRRSQAEASSSSLIMSPKREHVLPPGVLTPLLKRHRDLDNELKTRLQKLEEKYERGHKEVQMAELLSPVSRKKLGRSYVALARAHSEKGDLEVALELYRKAESYVPDNMKLKERIVETELAAKNNTPWNPSPKRTRRSSKEKKRTTTKVTGYTSAGADLKLDESRHVKEQANAANAGIELGLGLANTELGKKRPLASTGDSDSGSPAPPKRRKHTTKLIHAGSDGDEEFVRSSLLRDQ
ncbi:hypothetical protein AX16_005116 [Volvariella volvacea WC 439]|nr:hypothetical protein AX16_005116 [Volvariella volvacea WC 439]